MKHALALIVMLFCLAGCARVHPHRVPQNRIRDLEKRGNRSVLVFGSVKALEGERDVTGQRVGSGTAVRFLYEDPSSGLKHVLREVSILSGDRFYAVLTPPATAKYLDHFDAEVRWADPVFDAVTHIKLRELESPLALYVGEIEMAVAGRGSAAAVAEEHSVGPGAR